MARRLPLGGPGGPQTPHCRPWRRNKREGWSGSKGASEQASERRPGDQTHVARKKEALGGSEKEGRSREREWWRGKKREKRTENPHPSRGLLRDLFVLSVQTEHPWKSAVRFHSTTWSCLTLCALSSLLFLLRLLILLLRHLRLPLLPPGARTCPRKKKREIALAKHSSRDLASRGVDISLLGVWPRGGDFH